MSASVPRSSRRRLRPLLALLVAGATAGLGACAPATPAASPPGPERSQQARAPQGTERIQVLFLGDAGHHRPAERLRDVATPLLNRGIELHYTENLADLHLENLRKYDALLLYANYEGDLPAEYEQALLTYVREGGGFVPVHCAAGNFRTSEAFVRLLGAQFASHDTATFRTRIVEPDHPVMQGFEGFESWDETYVHKNHNPEGRTVLAYRGDEPYTWVREEGKGRVFYTAWGHDERTWRNPGFLDLLERGIRWAVGQDVPTALAEREIRDPFEYAVLDVPFPPPHRVRMQYEATVGPMDRKSNYPLFYQMQLALSPEESMERMIVPPGFRVELFASEPDIVNPIAMTWDERGRLWVVESVEYPYPREMWPDGGGKDRIVIAEDTDHDGRADKFTEFADGFNIPTGLTFANGGVIVHQAPQTIFLKDTDGDDRADVRKVLFEGWSQRDTHAGPSHLRYGLDNWVWGVVGYSGFKGTIGGEEHEFSMGVYRFRPDGSKFEFLRRTNNNTWGLGFNEQGGAFISTANGNPSTYLPFPIRGYAGLPELEADVTQSLASTPRMIPLSNEFRQVDWVGAYTAGSGHAVYTARTYPREYWNRIAFVNEPTGHLVGEFLLEENGSTYKAEYPRNLVVSDDQWFAPVVAEVGPDGNVWIADWYNYVIQHNAESDRQKPAPGNAYANPLRDRQHGRIYRIVYEGAPPAEPMSLEGASPQKLVETLRHPNRLWRMHAQRLLVERGQRDVVPRLIELVQDTSVDELGLNPGAIHALWTLHGLGALDGSDPRALEAARTALRHPSAGVRRNAVQVLPATEATTADVLAAGLLEDEDPQVRLQAAATLADLPGSEAAGRALFAALQRPGNANDEWMREAMALAAAKSPQGFLAAAAAAGVEGAPPPAPNAEDAPSPVSTLAGIVGLVARHADPAAGGAAVAATAGEADVVLEVGVVPDVLRFDRTELSAQAGQRVRIVFRNTDNMEHNLVFIEPGSLAKIGRLADELATSPQGRSRQYVPDAPEVVASTPVLGPGQSYELTFTAPTEPGRYTFICTIPGHWRVMQGTLVVEPAASR